MKKILVLGLSVVLSFGSAYAACSKKDAEAAVKKACELYKKNKDEAFKEMQTFRFCGDNNNYVWFQNMDASKDGPIVLAFHPVAPGLVGPDFRKKDDAPKIKELFIKLDTTLRKAAASKKPESVEYDWTKQGEDKMSPKVSVMMLCDDKVGAGAGFWK